MVTETDIANRALQRVGAVKIAPGALRTEDSKNADEIRTCYDILRRAELRRNVWTFSIRVAALRAIGDNSKLVTFGTWASGTSYSINDVVTGSDGLVYASLTANNVAHDPTSTYGYWQLYFGSLIAQEYVTTWNNSITYASGDHAVGSNGSVYISLVDSNLNHDPVSDGGVHWSVTTDGVQEDSEDYYAGEIVYIGNQVYLSKISANSDDPPGSSNWLDMTTQAAVAPLNFIYPIGSGPFTNNQTRNVYRLPNGYLRTAPQLPKAGSRSFLGAPSGLPYNDWEFQDKYITTTESGVILFRFAADIADPNQFDPMFVEGFAARIALEVCEPITQSDTKLQGISAIYNKFMSEARTVNGIETGPTQPPEDDYITTRM